MVEVGILYTGNVQVWKPLLNTASFKRKEVQTITITSERGNRNALIARHWSEQNNDKYAGPAAWHGEDNYLIGIFPNGDFLTDQWADLKREFLVRSSDDGRIVRRLPNPRTYPPGAALHYFRGEYVSPEEWKIVLAIFEEEMW